jgi:phosphopantothenoylcysteine decarboxylase / phosphopantothenate---cysteine ligase
MARLLVGVTGGIAAYKAVELVRLAGKAGHAVRVVATPEAERFVGAATFAGITGAPVLSDPWARDPARGAFPDQAPPDHDPISHLAVVGHADAFLIAPATANTLARLAHGLADNLLCEMALAAGCPVAVAPAMNDRMWSHPATQANVALLRDRGVTVIDPGEGELASRGEHGVGRLAEPPDLLAAVEALLPATGAWEGLRVLVTAGGTREPIDAVRFLGNRSSGRMGFALAEAATRRGARVTVVAANVSLPRRAGVRYVDVQTAAELRDACTRAFAEVDVLLMAAAVADFRPAAPTTEKLKKDQGVPVLELEATPDVLTALSEARRPGQTLVGFAAEAGEAGLEHARGKLERKGLDLVVLNDVSRPGIAFDAPENEVTLLSADGAERSVARGAKALVADAILDEVMRLRGREAERGAGREHV